MSALIKKVQCIGKAITKRVQHPCNCGRLVRLRVRHLFLNKAPRGTPATQLLRDYVRNDANTDADCAVAVKQFTGYADSFDWEKVLSTAVRKARRATVHAIAATAERLYTGTLAYHGLQAAAAANNGMVHTVITAFGHNMNVFQHDLSLKSALKQGSLVDVALILAHGTHVCQDSIAASTVPGITRLLSMATEVPRACPCTATSLTAHESAHLTETLTLFGTFADDGWLAAQRRRPLSLAPFFALCGRLLSEPNLLFALRTSTQ